MKRLLFFILLLIVACKEKRAPQNHSISATDSTSVKYAKGFTVDDYKAYKVLKVFNLDDKSKTYTYFLHKAGIKKPKNISYDYSIRIPINKVVLTSTTHIPPLILLNEENSLIGFPHLDYISSPEIRTRIDHHKITELGENENINFETLLSLQPDAMVGFTIDQNATYDNILKSGIPIVFNRDWQENTPLGKAEWIKFFGALFDKSSQADSIFTQIETNYNTAKQMISDTLKKPKILSGAMYKDVWYTPGGKSWAAQFIKDAGGDYLYKDTDETGSLSLSFESVYESGREADIWINPSEFTSLESLKNSSRHYTEFKPYKGKEIYSYADKKGATGGLFYFEEGPSRPDLILKDLIHIFHPSLLPKDYKPTFYQVLK